LIHELAHLLTFMQFGNYRRMLEEFIHLNIFPEDIITGIKKSLHNLPASSCADDDLIRVLRKHDAYPSNSIFVEELEEGRLFSIDNGQVFQKGKRVRKRFQCKEISTGRIYLFSPVFEVKVV
jgi:hypothetical protein